MGGWGDGRRGWGMGLAPWRGSARHSDQWAQRPRRQSTSQGRGVSAKSQQHGGQGRGSPAGGALGSELTCVWEEQWAEVEPPGGQELGGRAGPLFLRQLCSLMNLDFSFPTTHSIWHPRGTSGAWSDLGTNGEGCRIDFSALFLFFQTWL